MYSACQVCIRIRTYTSIYTYIYIIIIFLYFITIIIYVWQMLTPALHYHKSGSICRRGVFFTAVKILFSKGCQINKPPARSAMTIDYRCCRRRPVFAQHTPYESYLYRIIFVKRLYLNNINGTVISYYYNMCSHLR